MSIPGLGQIPTQPVASATRTVTLKPFQEFRFHIAHSSSPTTIRLLSGKAEKDGTELAPRTAYTFYGTKGKILTWHGCELEIEGATAKDEVKSVPDAGHAAQLLNLDAQLQILRDEAEEGRTEGPRVLVVGPEGTGKTTAVRTLAAYATKMGYSPLVVNTDPKEGMLSFPGTLSAAVFATVMDPQAADHWGHTPTTSPSPVPVKLPLVFYFGKDKPTEDVHFFEKAVATLSRTATGRLSQDAEVRRSGSIVDTFAVDAGDRATQDILAHVVDELSVNIIVVVDSAPLLDELSKRFADEKTSLGEYIIVTSIDMSDGVAPSDQTFTRGSHEASMKEYFFGDTRRSLSPQIQQVDFDSLVIYKAPEHPDDGQVGLTREPPSDEMQHWIMAVMHASPKDPPDVIRTSSVMGFVYISEVDEDRRKLKVLAPESGRLGDRPLVWGQRPEPFLSLLG